MIDIVDSLIIIPIVMLFFMNEILGGRGYKDYLFADNCKAVKGFLAIIIVLTHIVLRVSSGVIFKNIFVYVGYLAVADFFFFLDMGCSFLTKNEEKNIQID